MPSCLSPRLSCVTVLQWSVSDVLKHTHKQKRESRPQAASTNCLYKMYWRQPCLLRKENSMSKCAHLLMYCCLHELVCWAGDVAPLWNQVIKPRFNHAQPGASSWNAEVVCYGLRGILMANSGWMVALINPSEGGRLLACAPLLLACLYTAVARPALHCEHTRLAKTSFGFKQPVLARERPVVQTPAAARSLRNCKATKKRHTWCEAK